MYVSVWLNHFAVQQKYSIVNQLYLKIKIGLSLVVQWFPMHPQVGGAGSIPGWGTKIAHAVLHDQE